MESKLTIISKSSAIYEQIRLIFSNETYKFSFENINTITSETFSATDSNLVLIDITHSIIDNIRLLLNSIDLKSIHCAIVCIIENKFIPEFHFLEESYKVHFVTKPIRKQEFCNRVKKMLFLLQTDSQTAYSQQQLQWELKKQTSDLAATFQIAEYQSHLLDLILNSVPAGFIAIDTSQDVVMMNKNAEEILKVPFSKAVGKSVWKIVEKDIKNHLQELLYNNVTESFENLCIIKDPNGVENYYEIVIRDFFDNDRVIIGKLLIFVNVTSRIEANRIKNSFFTIVSHELRTPLTIINNGVMLLKLEKNSALQDQIISDISEATERSSELVTNILHITYLHEINVHPFYREIRKSDLLNKLFNQFQLKLSRKRIELIQNDTTDTISIITDPGLINMVLSSILDNAIKYNKDNGRVFFSIYRENDFFCFKIKDEGNGFEEETSKMFFNSFMQGENNLTRTHNGIGIGLYIAKRASELVKGKIAFTSESKIGSTFVFKIPFIPKLDA